MGGNLEQVSIEVMNAMVEEYKRRWCRYAPFTLASRSSEGICLYNCDNNMVCFSRPKLEDWNISEGLGKALKAIVKDPGMHGSAMWLYGKPELSELSEMMLCDFEGEPTELGKKVYNAIMEK